MEHLSGVKELLERSQDTLDVSRGAQTHRFYPDDTVVLKVAASEQGLMSQEAYVDNMRSLSEADIKTPQGVVVIEDLSENGYGPETPVLVQEQADSVYQGGGERWPKSFLADATTILDQAATHNLILDASVTNFGRFDGEIAYMDVQDEKSVQYGVGDDLDAMYMALARSAAAYGDLTRDEAETVVYHVSDRF